MRWPRSPRGRSLMWTKQEAWFAVPFGMFELALLVIGVLD